MMSAIGWAVAHLLDMTHRQRVGVTPSAVL